MKNIVNRKTLVLSSIAKFAALGAAMGALKSGYVAMKTDAGIELLFMAPVIGAGFFGVIGLIVGLAKAGVHKTKVEKIANKEMGYLGQVIAAIIIFGIIILLANA